MATALGTPFISGKDSLNNEFRPQGRRSRSPSRPRSDQRPGPGRRRAPLRDHGPEGAGQLAVPGRPDARTSWAGRTSPWSRGSPAARSPKVDAARGPADLRRPAPGDHAGLVRACHDLSEGGLAVAAAEMAFAGGLGAQIDLGRRAADETRPARRPCCCSAESNTRFLCEVRPDRRRGVRGRAGRRAARPDRRGDSTAASLEILGATADDRRRVGNA